MANPQKENGYVQIANEIIEAMARCDCFSGSRGQIMWVIFRKTYGWNKKADDISLSQIAEMTRLSKRTVIYALQELEAKKIIFIIRSSKDGLKATNNIRFNKDYDTWVVQNYAPQVEKNRIMAKISSAKLRKHSGSSAKLRKHSGSSAKLRKHSGSSAKLGKIVVQNSVNILPSFAHTKDTLTKDNTKDNSGDSPPARPFILGEYIKKLEDSTRRDMNIIALYLEKRKPNILSYDQMKIALNRHLRPAKALIPFTDDQIIDAIPKAKKLTEGWTLETLIKILTK